MKVEILFFSKIINHNNPIHVGCISVGKDGIVGLHEATISQLFLVVQGEGWVSGKEGARYNIDSGYAAFWESGEIHESGSEEGMIVIIIESENLEPRMNEINWIEG
jgi:quercetin dioxygenase-like cupin family protein